MRTRGSGKGVIEMLTPKQEKFVQNLIKGMSQREAYKNSYDAENMSDEAIDVEACRLFNSPNISLRYQELQDKLMDEAIMTAQERMKFLTDVIKGNKKAHKMYVADGDLVEYDEEADFNAKLKALDLMNKMDGQYTTKIEADVNQSVNINISLEDDE